MQKPVLVEIEAFHENCFAINTQEKFPEAKIMAMPGAPISAKTMSFYTRVSGPEAGKAIEIMRRQPSIKQFKVVYGDENHTLIQLALDKKYSSMCSCIDAGAVLNEPAITENMHDTLSLVFQDGKAVKRFADCIRDKFDFRLKSKIEIDPKMVSGLAFFSKHGFTQLKTVSMALSEAQREAFDLAVAKGYYNEPQKTSVAELALETGVGPSTFGEHLRKAEAKLMPVLGQLMKYL